MITRYISQSESRAAVLAILAAAAAGEEAKRRPVADWLARQQFPIGERGIRGALTQRMAGHGAAPSAVDPADRAWIRPTLDFDAAKLDLDLVLAVFPAPEHPDNLLRELRQTQRIIRAYRGYDGAIVAVVVFDRPHERRSLRAHFEELESGLIWIDVRDVDDGIGADSWLSLASKVAKSEPLRLNDG